MSERFTICDKCQENLTYCIQKLISARTGDWHIVATFRGKGVAYKALNDMKKGLTFEQSSKLRVVAKNEADKFQEGINVGKKLAAIEHDKEDKPKRLPLMYMPDNL